MGREDENRSDVELSKLAALADGSLTGPERERLAARVDDSPELRALLKEQHVALAATRALDVQAPASVLLRVPDALPAPARRSRFGSFALAGGIAAAAVAAATVAIVLIAGGSGAPTISEVAELASRGPSSPPPGADPAEPALLNASVDGVPFPDYATKLGWKASGERADELGDRSTKTVFYDREGEGVAYSIVAGEALPWPPESQLTTIDGTELHHVEDGETTIVAWLREGRTCVLSGTGVPRDELLELAAWKGEGAVPF